MTSEKQIEANRRNAACSTGPQSADGKAVVSQNAVRHGLRSQWVVIEGESQAEFDDFRNRLIAQLTPADSLEMFLVDRIAAGFWRLRRTGQIEAEMFDAMRQSLAAESRPNMICSPDLRFGDIFSEADAASCTFTDDDNDAIDDEFPFSDRKALPAAVAGMKRRCQHHPRLYNCLSALEETFSALAEIPQDRHSIPAFRQYIQGLSELLSKTDDTQQEYLDGLNHAIVFLEYLEKTIARRQKPTLGKTLYRDFKGPDSLGKFTRYEAHIQRSLFTAMHELQRLQAKRQNHPVSPPIAVDINLSGDKIME